MQNNQNNSNLIYKWEVITHLLPFLKLSDILSTASLSKQWNYNLNQYIKKAILPSHLENIHASPMVALKMFYNRKVQILVEDQASTCQIPYIVDKISVGNLVTSLCMVDGSFVLAYNGKFQKYSSKDWKEGNNVIKLGKKYNEVKCIGNYVYCLRNEEIFRFEPNQQSILSEEKYLNFDGSITYLNCSFKYGLVVVAEKSQFFVFEHKQFMPIEVKLNKEIENIFELSLFQNNLVFCSEGTPYEVNLGSDMKVNEMKMFKGKNIARIVHGYRHCFAFERKNKLFRQLNNNEVLKWAEQEGFDDYLKIFKTEKVTGKKLLDMERQYMEDVLGITNVKIQQRMKVRIHECNEENPHQFIVHGWGRNDKAQLCTNPSPNVTNPIKVKLPQNCIIWKCLGDKTIIRNTTTQELLVTKHEGNKLEWSLLSKSRIWGIDIYRNGEMGIISSIQKEKIPQALSEVPVHNKKQKLRTAKNIIDKIIWDQNMKKEDFRVGYLDKFTGMLESSLEELLKSEVKEYRIMYFKCKGSIVWDKKARIDVL